MVANVKISILALATRADLSGTYGALLYMTALMESSAQASATPESEEERIIWDGHMRGLVSALHCGVMHELRQTPEISAAVVDSLLNRAR